MSPRNGEFETVTRRTRKGEAIRVSRYLKGLESMLLLSETILYRDGSFCLHLYDESGKIKDVIKYDGNGDITPLTKLNLLSRE